MRVQLFSAFVLVGAFAAAGRSALRRSRLRRRWPARNSAPSLFTNPVFRRFGDPEAALAESMADVLEAMARSLRVGNTLPIALEKCAVGPQGAAISPVVQALRRGATPPEAFAQWRSGSKSKTIELVATAFSLSMEAGGRLAEAVDGIASSLRQRQRMAQDIRAKTAQARLSAWVLLISPVGLACMVVAVDASARAFLTGTPLGWAVLVLGLVLDVAGGFWMARLAAAVSR